MTHQLDIHDMVEELTRTHTHRERYEVRQGLTLWSKDHVTLVPALILQLLEATPAGSRDESGSAGAKSKPAARIEAIDTIMLIDDEATRWLARLGVDDPNERLDPRTRLPIPAPRATTGRATIAVINKLHGLRTSQDGDTQGRIDHDIRRWWHQARIITGWDSPSWRPNNTCPMCEQRRTLRINLVMQAALCVECREVWDTTTIGLLADHIRSENEDDATDTVEAS